VVAGKGYEMSMDDLEQAIGTMNLKQLAKMAEK